MTIEEQNEKIEIMIYEILQQCLVVDIETSSFYPGGEEINISSNFEDYVKFADVRWLGCYSYRDSEVTIWNHHDKKDKVLKLLSTHKYIIGFNISDFDHPILVNNKFINDEEKVCIVDCMTILGQSSFTTKKGFPFKGRGTLMDYDFPSNSLRTMSEVMGLETQKGEIDYKIFQKYTWTEQESKDITKYLTDDVMATKQMFDKLISYWTPFCYFLPDKSINDLSWIRGSIASVVYKALCYHIGEEPTYADRDTTVETESMGGNVLLPTVEEANDVWYIDFASLYPHIMTQFNLFNEVPEGVSGKYIFHDNGIFKTKGYYDISRPHPISALLIELLKRRIELKKTDPKNPMVYTLKIFVNAAYGVLRSKTFEKVHRPTAGYDTCYLGQQLQKLVIDMMDGFGFDTIYGDTDSCMLLARDKKNSNETYVKECIKKIMDKIFANVPFPVATFNIAIEHRLDYILFNFEDQPVVGEDGKNIKVKNRLVLKKTGLKKNYLFIHTDKEGKKHVEIKGLPIIKNNATKLGYEIFDNVLRKKIEEKGHAKFPKEEIDSIVNGYLQREDAMEWISIEYKVKPAKSYKKESQIHAQISKAYFHGSDGQIRLIKNNKVGKAGKGTKYCSIPEALDAKLTVADLDLEKLTNELNPFCKSDVPVVIDNTNIVEVPKCVINHFENELNKRMEE